MIPIYATHYYLPDRTPFLNLSDLEADELEVVLRDLQDNRAETGLKRVFGSKYMEYRRRTESKLRGLFEDSGGKPERDSPHYFVLGSSQWFKGLATTMREVRIPLSELPSAATSFTLCDSFTAMALGPDYGVPYEARAHHERAFRLEELSTAISEYGMPADEPVGDYHDYHRQLFEQYVEIQLWSDQPILMIER